MQKSIYSSTYASFLEWLKAARVSRGLTIRELAALLDEHPSVIGKIEKGHRHLDVLEYVQYCAALNIRPVDGVDILRKGLDL